MSYLHAVILGIVEGFTEFLPISSTGHLILTAHLLNIQNSDFVKSFEIVIQLGAITAVMFIYWRMLVRNISLWGKIIVAFIPTGIVGLALYSIVKKYLLGNSTVVLWSLFLGGLMLIVFEYWKTKDEEGTMDSLTYKQAFLIGLAQCVALVPGVSRSAATIIAGRSLRLSRRAAVEFSFLLSIPVMIAATGLDLLKHAGNFSADQTGIIFVGFVVSGLVAAIAVTGLIRFVRNHTFVSFGIYRVIIAVIFFIIMYEF